jgi:hypothetical protein
MESNTGYILRALNDEVVSCLAQIVSKSSTVPDAVNAAVERQRVNSKRVARQLRGTCGNLASMAHGSTQSGNPIGLPSATMSVQSFNALHQPRLSPSGLPNHWHFDLRYIALNPTPSHVLFLVQLDSGYIHSERLPLVSHVTKAELHSSLNLEQKLPRKYQRLSSMPSSTASATTDSSRTHPHRFPRGNSQLRILI